MAVKKQSKSKPVRLAQMSGEEFKGKLNALRKRETPTGYAGIDLQNDFMVNLDAKLFTGGTTINKQGNTGYKSVPASIGVNIATMTNLDRDLLDAMGISDALTDEQMALVERGTANPLYTGNFDYEVTTPDGEKEAPYAEFKTFDGEKYMGSTPVGLKVEFDEHANNVKSELDKFVITPAIDFRALGSASTAEQNRIREAKGKPPLSQAQSNRLKVVASYPVTQNGLGGMNGTRVNQNVAKCAAANGIMDTSKPMPTTDQVQAVSDLYTQTFNAFVKEVATKPCKGIEGIKNPGTFATDKNGQQITCPSLKQMGIKPVEVNGATVLVVTGDESGKKERRDGLKKFNEAFNARWKQVVNERSDKEGSSYVHDASTVSLGNMMSLNSRAVTVRNPFDRDKKTGMVLVQPALDVTMTPYADQLAMSVGSATHELGFDKHGKQQTPEDIYSKELLESADKLSTAFDGPEISQEEAVKANAAQFKAICDAVGMDYEATLNKQPSVAEEEMEGPEA